MPKPLIPSWRRQSPQQQRADDGTPRMLTAEQVAERLNVCRRTVFKLVAAGKFPEATLRLSKKLVRWSSAAVDAWIEAKGGEAA